MAKKRADIFAFWKEIMVNKDIKLADAARGAGIDYKWLKDFMNKEIISLQTYNVRKLEDFLKVVGHFDKKRYDSGFDDIEE